MRCGRSFFSESYRDFQRHLLGVTRVVLRRISSEDLIAVQGDVGENLVNAEFWRRHLRGMPKLPAFDRDILPVFDALRRELEPLIAAKLANPLEQVNLSPGADAALKRLSELRARIDRWNDEIQMVNANIDDLK